MITPCISVCTVGENGKCIGCDRTPEEIRDWYTYTSDQRMEIMRRLGYGKRMGREERLRRYERG